MTMPLLMNAGTQEERRLLLAARGERPNSQLAARVLFSVGVGTAGVTGAAASHAAVGNGLANATSRAAHQGAATGALSPTSVAVLVKWIGIAGIALLAGTGAGFVAGSAWADNQVPQNADVRRGTDERRGTDVRRGTDERRREFVARPWAPVGEVSPVNLAPRAEPVAQSAATLPLPPPRVPTNTAARLQHAISDEVRLIDEARTALRTGDATRCLRLLNERRLRFPHGVLLPEATLLRIEALHVSGQAHATIEEGQRFLSHYPAGPLAARVRLLLDQRAEAKTETAEAAPSDLQAL